MEKFFDNIKHGIVGFVKQRRLSAWQNYVFLVLFALALTFLEFVYPVDGIRTFLKNLISSPVFFLLNMLPILATTLLLYFITNSLRASVIVNFLFYNVIFIINRIKILYRNEPLFVSDLRLGVESVTISKGQNYSPGVAMLLLSAVALIALIFVIFYFKPAKARPVTRVVGVLAVVFGSYLMYSNVYVDQMLYRRILPNVSIYSDRASSENKGILYYLLYSTQFSKISVPEGYDKKEFEGIADAAAEVGVKPNILMIMGEAYFDLSDLDVFEFADGVRPTSNFDRLSEEALLSGRIVVPSFGGGTADTEFDVLTGCMTIRCAPNMSFAFNSVLKDTDSIASVLARNGYFTRAFHPGYDFFYKRQTVYPRLGFEDIYFENSIENQILVSGYLEEKLTFDEYIRRLDEHVAASEMPLFDYMVTIQNHGPYYRGKFGKEYEFGASVELEDSVRGCVESFFEGVHEMDVELGRLAELVENSPEPFVIVFYGDHLPSLVGGDSSYNQLGFDITSSGFDSTVRRYSTPYMIWANKSYRQALEKQYGARMMPEELETGSTALISANYLGGLVLQLTGMDKTDDFFENLCKIRNMYPVLSRGYVFDGNEARAYDEVSDDALNRYFRYQYYRLHD